MDKTKFQFNLKPITIFFVVILIGISLIVLSFGMSSKISGDKTTEYSTKALYTEKRAAELTATADLVRSTAAPIAALSSLLIGAGVLFTSILLGGGTFRLLLAVSRGIEQHAEAVKVERISKSLKDKALVYLVGASETTASIREVPLVEAHKQGHNPVKHGNIGDSRGPDSHNGLEREPGRRIELPEFLRNSTRPIQPVTASARFSAGEY